MAETYYFWQTVSQRPNGNPAPHIMQRKIFFFTPKARLGCSDNHKLIGCTANWYIPLCLEYVFITDAMMFF